MAEDKITKKGFKIIKVEAREFANLGSPCLCDHCMKRIQDYGIYISVLNHYVCRTCFRNWHDTAIWYDNDERVETRNHEYYRKMLGLS